MFHRGTALIGAVTATLASWIVDQVNLETDRREDAREKEVAKEAAQEAIATSANPESTYSREVRRADADSRSGAPNLSDDVDWRRGQTTILPRKVRNRLLSPRIYRQRSIIATAVFFSRLNPALDNFYFFDIFDNFLFQVDSAGDWRSA
ncbi:MAG: hypothetical protein ACLT3W_02405 [Bifidobacterium pseudocatenulatum]